MFVYSLLISNLACIFFFDSFLERDVSVLQLLLQLQMGQGQRMASPPPTELKMQHTLELKN